MTGATGGYSGQNTLNAQSGAGIMDEDPNLVEAWLQKDVKRWIAGVLAGLVGGVLSLAFAALLAALSGMEALYPLKVLAVVFMGPEATEFGAHMGPIILGSLVYLALFSFLGFVFAHYVRTNRLQGLLAMGLVWGVFSWIFIVNLFSPSFHSIFALQIPSGAALLIMLVYGISLTSVAFFDRVLKGAR